MELITQGVNEAIQLIIAGDPLVLSAAWRSLWISLTAVVLAAFFGISIGSVLARRKFWGRRALTILFRAGMGLPTVFIGLVGYALFSRQGPLGPLDMLYSPWAIVAGEST